jgi:hypothetical protein
MVLGMMAHDEYLNKRCFDCLQKIREKGASSGDLWLAPDELLVR